MKVKLTASNETKKDNYIYDKLLDAKSFLQNDEILEGLSVLPYGVDVIVNDMIKVNYDKTEYGFSGVRGIWWIYLNDKKEIGYYNVGFSDVPSDNIIKFFDNIAKVEIKYVGSTYHREPMFT